MITRMLTTLFVCLVAVSANYTSGLALQSSPAVGVVPPPRQAVPAPVPMPATTNAVRPTSVQAPAAVLAPAATAATTNAVRPHDSRVPARELRVKWEAGKLSLDAEGVPLSEVLQAVSRKVGIELTGVQGLHDPVFAHFAAIDLRQALQGLLSRLDYAIIASPSGSASSRGTRVVIFNEARDSKLAEPPAEAETIEPASSGSGNDEEDKKMAAVEAASSRKDWGTLRRYLRDPDAQVQAAAFDALSEHDKDGAIASLLAQFRSAGSADSRLQALTILDQSGVADDQTMVAALRDALRDPDSDLNSYAVQALVGHGGEQAMDALTEALHSPDPATRLMVVESVAQTDEGLPLLREAASDPDESVSSAATALLKEAQGDAASKDKDKGGGNE